jgi:hypothetical protein
VAELAEREVAWRYDGRSAPTRRGRFGTALRRVITRSGRRRTPRVANPTSPSGNISATHF